VRQTSYPPELQKFVDAVEENVETAGRSPATAKIFGAWAACFVRFCTLHDRLWREAKHVPAFLNYLGDRQDVDREDQYRAAEAMAFLFGELLKQTVVRADWHPSNWHPHDTAAESEPAEEEGEQSTLLTRLLFHTSLPIEEALDLCAGDVDLDAGLIYVSDAMGTPKRIIELPDTLHDPLEEHLRRLRKEHGPRYFDAPLFQARALQGRVDEDAETEQQAEPVPADTADEPDDGPSSLWGYAEQS